MVDCRVRERTRKYGRGLKRKEEDGKGTGRTGKERWRIREEKKKGEAG